MDLSSDLPESMVSEQAVIARYRLSGDRFGSPAERGLVFEASRVMSAEVEKWGVGEVDGNEFGAGEVTVYAYGPDAQALFGVMEPILRSLPMRPAHVVLRQGSPETETCVDL
ncbi:hypothetical protein ACFT9I_12965 [Streptomyces sp. NPDC057137]|uniref:hypothetical protein n=1 Tax=Streptomyces sp. NPDC057137 TaxID=3346030 RepID=UPI00363B8A9B